VAFLYRIDNESVVFVQEATGRRRDDVSQSKFKGASKNARLKGKSRRPLQSQLQRQLRPAEAGRSRGSGSKRFCCSARRNCACDATMPANPSSKATATTPA